MSKLNISVVMIIGILMLTACNQNEANEDESKPNEEETLQESQADFVEMRLIDNDESLSLVNLNMIQNLTKSKSGIESYIEDNFDIPSPKTFDGTFDSNEFFLEIELDNPQGIPISRFTINDENVFIGSEGIYQLSDEIVRVNVSMNEGEFHKDFVLEGLWMDDGPIHLEAPKVVSAARTINESPNLFIDTNTILESKNFVEITFIVEDSKNILDLSGNEAFVLLLDGEEIIKHKSINLEELPLKIENLESHHDYSLATVLIIDLFDGNGYQVFTQEIDHWTDIKTLPYGEVNYTSSKTTASIDYQFDETLKSIEVMDGNHTLKELDSDLDASGTINLDALDPLTRYQIIFKTESEQEETWFFDTMGYQINFNSNLLPNNKVTLQQKLSSDKNIILTDDIPNIPIPENSEGYNINENWKTDDDKAFDAWNDPLDSDVNLYVNHEPKSFIRLFDIKDLYLDSLTMSIRHEEEYAWDNYLEKEIYSLNVPFTAEMMFNTPYEYKMTFEGIANQYWFDFSRYEDEEYKFYGFLDHASAEQLYYLAEAYYSDYLTDDDFIVLNDINNNHIIVNTPENSDLTPIVLPEVIDVNELPIYDEHGNHMTLNGINLIDLNGEWSNDLFD